MRNMHARKAFHYNARSVEMYSFLISFFLFFFFKEWITLWHCAQLWFLSLFLIPCYTCCFVIRSLYRKSWPSKKMSHQMAESCHSMEIFETWRSHCKSCVRLAIFVDFVKLIFISIFSQKMFFFRIFYVYIYEVLLMYISLFSFY